MAVSLENNGAESFRALLTADATVWAKTRQAAFSARLLVPLMDSPKAPTGSHRLLTVTDPQGGRWLPCFAGEIELRRWIRRRRDYAEMAAEKVLGAAARDRAGIVVDPGTDRPVVLNASSVVLLVEGRRGTMAAAAAPPVLFATEDDDSPELAQIVSTAARLHRCVEAAYLLRGFTGTGPEHGVVGVVYRDSASEDERAAFLAELARRVKPSLGHDFVDCVSLSASALAALGDARATYLRR